MTSPTTPKNATTKSASGASENGSEPEEGKHERRSARTIQNQPSGQRHQEPHCQRGLQTIARCEGHDPRGADGHAARPARPARDVDPVEQDSGLTDGEQAEDERRHLQLQEIVATGREVDEHRNAEVQRTREALNVLSAIEDGSEAVDDVRGVPEGDEGVVGTARECAADRDQEGHVQEDCCLRERECLCCPRRMIIRLEHDALVRRSHGRHHANRMLSLDLPTLPSMEASSHLVMNAYVTSRECWIRSDVRESSRCARPPRMT